ncbi:DedA family protein [Falsarthrobacter nasiphocae]|uniref:Membrane protein DedA with SNARE-associated domain n=1 Tax=Falsarthrobacter nasiphocae TaxID=189863 RepID=A0AAE4C792_9MICC|nr:DedA family protein [Falsarthrobacter nasiphocae]MDR6892314.1 membrane protein DedA with SNARE-associated domain [Falsarthrobacter nasiphocae]
MDIPSFLGSIPPWLVYALVGLVVGVESIGIPLPGETILVASTLLSLHPDANINPWIIAACATTGAVIGDSIGYTVGRTYGTRLLTWLTRRFPRHISPAHIKYAEHVFDRWGTWTVFFGRFVAGLRILAGPLAGTLRIEYRRFLLANVTGGIFWAFGTVGFIVLVGDAAHHYLKEFAWVGFLAVLVLALAAGGLLHKRVKEGVARFAAEEPTEAQEPERA